ncbi:hypothetical protein GCM10010988_19110 [Cnuibacter physcomitrellae]|uniref:hypothetical protein n=1 Tax=Cnuibacter physcomitrellae TaxID=1619308 RepID=UPI0012F4CAF5|nr:hypothetical protein [Cnuibacter physcomitrellae]GGI38459.1 hypothetical protein GCM10010988_19110 [Cnuibacter physcomitrellae]
MSDEHSIPDAARTELGDELRSIRATGEDEWPAEADADGAAHPADRLHDESPDADA